MEDPEYCSICNQRLRRIWHAVAHERHFHQRVEIRTCPHNILAENHFANPRHDEWHMSDRGWVKREE